MKKDFLSFLLCISFLFSAYYQSLAQDQLALWTFDNLSNIYSGKRIYASQDNIPGTPHVEQKYAGIDDNGTSGRSHTDVEGTYHSATRAIKWYDADRYGNKAELRIYFNTLGYKDVHLRFDYKAESGSGGAYNFDLDYRIGSGSRREIHNNRSLTRDGSWHSKTIDLSHVHGMTDQGSVTLYLDDFRSNNKDLIFDNIEIYGTEIEYDQLAIWTFDQLSNITDWTEIAPTAEQVVGNPPVMQAYEDIDPNGRTGRAYTDVEQVSHSATRAIEWDDTYSSSEEAKLYIVISTKGYRNIHIRFDYKTDNYGPRNYDLRYKTSWGGSYYSLVSNGSLNNNGYWHSEDIDLSNNRYMDNRNLLIFRFDDFAKYGGNNKQLAFDNIEVYGTKTPCLLETHYAPEGGPLCVGETEDLDTEDFHTHHSLGNKTYTYKTLSGTGSVSVSHPDNTSEEASITGLTAGEANLRLIVEDEVGCKDSVDFSVTVKPLPAKLAQQNCGNCGKIKINICQQATFPNLDNLIMGGNANYESGATLQWYKNSGGAPGDPIAGPPTFNNNNPKTRRYWVSQEKNGCESDPIMVVVKINAATSGNFNLPPLHCVESELDLAAWVSDANSTASSYTFFESDPSQGNPSPIGSVTATNGVVDQFEYVVIAKNTPGTYTFWMVADNNFGCSSAASSTIQVFARPSLAPVANRYRSHGQFTYIPFFGSPPGVTYVWMNNNTDIGLGAMGTGNISFVASNTTGQTQVATITAWSVSTWCMSDTRTFTITVTPGPNRSSKPEGATNFLSFAATKANEHDVMLTWTSTEEDLILNYEIEKKVNDDEEFKSIATVEVLGSNVAYSQLDQNGMGNQNLYRLKLNLQDGSVQYSEEIEIGFDFVNNNRFALYPNPNKGQFTVEANFPLEESFSWQMTDVLGKVVMQGETTQQNTSFNISHLPSGIYHLVMTSPEGQRYLNRVIKE